MPKWWERQQQRQQQGQQQHWHFAQNLHSHVQQQLQQLIPVAVEPGFTFHSAERVGATAALRC
jgi:hypothetical protein